MLVAWDCESYLIGPVVPAPPIVVGTFAWNDGRKGMVPGLECGAWLRSTLEAGHHLTGANTVYDTFLACAEWPELIPTVLRAYDEGRIHDVRLREQLRDIRAGMYRKEEYEDESGEIHYRAKSYALGDMAARRLNRYLNKGADSWRLRYAELHAVPLDQWPVEAREYATDDAVSTLDVHLDQDAEPGLAEYLARVEADQCRASFALRCIGTRGMLLDVDAVNALTERLERERAGALARLTEAGVFRPSGTKNMARLRELVAAAYAGKVDAEGKPVPCPMTNGGAESEPQIATDISTLRESGDPLLIEAANEARIAKLLTGFIPAMRLGTNMPLACEYNPILDTGRTSCMGIRWDRKKGPQFQNFPRMNGVRECFVPRPGHVLCSVDYSQLELCTLAQIVYSLGCGSVLRDAINSGRDLHMDFACRMRGWDYDAVKALKKKAPYKDARQGAKAANFGFPGGLGVKRFVGYALESYGVKLDENEARRYQHMWRQMWPDCRAYQEATAAAIGSAETTGVIVDATGFARGNCRYTEACNTPFQHLAAAGAKRALWRLCKEGSALGIFPVAFVHDEVIAEVPESSMHESAEALARIMIEAMSELCPDVRITAEPALGRRWFKEMSPVFDSKGRLIPWEPGVSE